MSFDNLKVAARVNVGLCVMLPSFAQLATFDLLNFKKPSKKVTRTPKRNLILAFRTNTTMLALIQCPTETTQIEPVHHISKLENKLLCNM